MTRCMALLSAVWMCLQGYALITHLRRSFLSPQDGTSIERKRRGCGLQIRANKKERTNGANDESGEV